MVCRCTVWWHSVLWLSFGCSPSATALQMASMSLSSALHTSSGQCRGQSLRQQLPNADWYLLAWVALNRACVLQCTQPPAAGTGGSMQDGCCSACFHHVTQWQQKVLHWLCSRQQLGCLCMAGCRCVGELAVTNLEKGRVGLLSLSYLQQYTVTAHVWLALHATMDVATAG
jgi:hypothetical protein